MTAKVKSQTITLTSYVVKGIVSGELEENTLTESEITYNEYGKVIKRIKFLLHGEVDVKSTYEYDRNNLLLKEENYFPRTEIIEKKTFVYKDNLLLEENFHFMDGSFDKTVYFYRDNLLHEKKTFNEDGDLESCEEFHYESGKLFEKIICNYDGNILEKEIYKYDQNGNLTEKISESEGMTETTHYHYDETGRIISSGYSGKGEKTEVKYTYGTNDAIAEEQLFSRGKLLRTSVYEYNTDKMISKIVEKDILPGFESEHKTVRAFRYEYF